MTKEAIITLPDKRLRQKSEKVHVITDDILQLIDYLKAVALDWEDSRPHEASAAISAVQIGVMKKVIIVRDDFDDKKNRNFTALINPEIVKAEGEVVEDYEGCLSVPDVYGKVPRNSKIRVKAIDVDGNEVRFKSEGFLARILQHEIDHTNGIPFIDRIGEVEDAYFKLDDKGELQSLSYEKDIKKNSILWD